MSAAIRRAEIAEDLTTSKANRPPRSRRSLAGIWRGKGFENIDLEAELREARRELDAAIDRRSI